VTDFEATFPKAHITSTSVMLLTTSYSLLAVMPDLIRHLMPLYRTFSNLHVLKSQQYIAKETSKADRNHISKLCLS
jgi:hypothetical protein